MPNILIRINERTDGKRVTTLVVNNTSKLNTLGSELLRNFIEMVQSLEGDEQLRAVIIRGNGPKAFVGGADINEMAALDQGSARGFITLLHEACDAVRKLPVPVIARLEGYALGAGLELAAACDLRIAADTAKLGMPEVRLGIPSVIEAALLPRLIGWGRTRELLLLGEMVSAAEASKWGLVDRVVPAEKLDAEIDKVVASIVAGGPKAIRLQKKLIRQWEDLPIDGAIAAGIDAFEAAYATDEPRTIMQAYVAKREAKKKKDAEAAAAAETAQPKNLTD